LRSFLCFFFWGHCFFQFGLMGGGACSFFFFFLKGFFFFGGGGFHA